MANLDYSWVFSNVTKIINEGILISSSEDTFATFIQNTQQAIVNSNYSAPRSLKKAAQEGAPNYNNNTMWDKAQSLKGWKYGFGAKITENRLKNGPYAVDCSGFVSYVLGISGGSHEILESSNNLVSTIKLEASKLKNGDVIGSDGGFKSYDAGRKTGIDHIMIIIENPNNKKLYFCESVSGTGVKIQSIEDGVKSYNEYAKRNKFGETYVDNGITKTKQFYIGNYKKP